MKNTHDRQYDLYMMGVSDYWSNIGTVRRARRQLNRKWARSGRHNHVLAYCDYIRQHGYITGEV